MSCHILVCLNLELTHSHPLWCIYGFTHPSDDLCHPFRTPHAKEQIIQRPTGIDASLAPLEDMLGFSKEMVASLMWGKAVCRELRELGLLLLGESTASTCLKD